jgi:hypothetical protein
MADFKHDVANAHLVMGKMPKKHKLSAEEHQELKHAQAEAYCILHTAMQAHVGSEPQSRSAALRDDAQTGTTRWRDSERKKLMN